MYNVVCIETKNAQSWLLSAMPGMVSITLNSDWKEPWNDTIEHTEAAARALAFMLEWFAHPIYLTGDYPDVRASAAILMVFICVHCFVSKASCHNIFVSVRKFATVYHVRVCQYLHSAIYL